MARKGGNDFHNTVSPHIGKPLIGFHQYPLTDTRLRSILIPIPIPIVISCLLEIYSSYLGSVILLVQKVNLKKVLRK